MFVVHEVSKNNRFHIHSIIEKPNSITEQNYIKLICSLFEKTNFGYKHHWFDKPMDVDTYPGGWIGYMLKETNSNKPNGWINWNSCYLG